MYSSCVLQHKKQYLKPNHVIIDHIHIFHPSILIFSDAISINSENPDDMPLYGNEEGSTDMPIYGQGEVQSAHEEVMYDESGGAGGAPVIISVEEIERLKTEMAISFSGSHGNFTALPMNLLLNFLINLSGVFQCVFVRISIKVVPQLLT